MMMKMNMMMKVIMTVYNYYSSAIELFSNSKIKRKACYCDNNVDVRKCYPLYYKKHLL